MDETYVRLVARERTAQLEGLLAQRARLPARPRAGRPRLPAALRLRRAARSLIAWLRVGFGRPSAYRGDGVG
jgi:hypothetical protein